MTDHEFEQLFRQTKAAVLAAVSRSLSRHLRDYIDDVVQETYLKAFKRLSKIGLSDVKSCENYLYTVAKNVCFTWNSKEKRYIEICDQWQHSEEPYIEESSDHTDKQVVIEQLSHVPEKFRGVLQLLLEGCSLNEIAVRLNLKVGTVKSKLFRGKQYLIKHMERRGV